VRVAPILGGLLEALDELGWAAVEDLTDSTGELLGAPEGTVGDIDVDGQRLIEVLVKDWAERGKDTLEGLNTATKIEALLAALEERLLDLCVLLRRPFAHDMIEEVDGVDALCRPGHLTLQEGIEVVEVDLAGVAEMEGVLVAALARLGGAALLAVKVASDAELVPIQAYTTPGNR